MGELKAIINERGDSKRFKQSQQAKDACAELITLIERTPRALTDPRALLKNHMCFIFMSDCGKHSTAQSFHLVDCPCATMVTLEMLQNPSMSRVLATRNRVRNKSVRAWHAWEGELKGMVDNCDDFGGIVETALMYQQAWQSKHPKEMKALREMLEIEETTELIKVGFFVDAQTAMGKWKWLVLPDPCQDHLAAKYLRFVGWIEKVARTAYWPCVVKWFSGLTISLCHLMSHMADLIEERKYCQQWEDKLRNDPKIMQDYHVSVENSKTSAVDNDGDNGGGTHVATSISSPVTSVMPSLSLPVTQLLKPDDPPDLRRLIYDPIILDMNTEEAEEVARALSSDETTMVHGVPLNVVYDYYTMGPKASSIKPGKTEDKKRLNAWAA